jgi:transcriptional regulator with PAS, ATPase and Fis domain
LQAEFEKKSAAIKEQATGELVLKIKEKKQELAELQQQYEALTGKPAKHTFSAESGVGSEKRTRTKITIEQVKKAIQGGAKNNADIAAHLGVSKANVASKVKKEGKAAGIKSKGERVNFEYYLA